MIDLKGFSEYVDLPDYAIAEKISMSPSVFNAIKNGRRKMKPKEFAQLKQAFPEVDLSTFERKYPQSPAPTVLREAENIYIASNAVTMELLEQLKECQKENKDLYKQVISLQKENADIRNQIKSTIKASNEPSKS